MRSRAEVADVLALASAGVSKSEIARRTGVPRGTVREWVAGRTPRERALGPGPPEAYAYLLGLYLGDGCIVHGPRTTCLRIFCDARHPRIIGECVRAMRAVRPDNRVWAGRRGTTRCIVVQCYSTAWPALFPQHGAGRKHHRAIRLAGWQRRITRRHPQALLRGLIHSDGSRFMNPVRHGARRYAYPRYAFTNRSDDIRAIFCEHLDLLGIAWRPVGRWDISIARREAVAALDAFVGPKG